MVIYNIHRDPQEIAMGNYFHTLCSVSEQPHFDPLFKSIIGTQLEIIMKELYNTHETTM